MHGSFVSSYLNARGTSAVLDKARRFDLMNVSGERISVELKVFEPGRHSAEAGFGAVMVDLRGKLQLEAERDAVLARLAMQAQPDELTSLPNRPRVR